MSYELRRITPGALNDVVRVMNGSSAGHTFQFQLDAAQFLSLSRLWNFSYAHSYLGYVDGEPAGIVLNSVDRVSLESYSFYWGVLPQFRGHRMSMALAFRYLDQVQHEGYLRAFADASSDSPHSIYERLGYHVGEKLIELRTMKPAPTGPSDDWTFRDLSSDEFLDLGFYGPNLQSYWTRRPHFIRSANRFLQILGCSRRGSIEAFAVVTSWPGYTVIFDCRSTIETNEPARRLIQHLVDEGYPAPFVACYLPAGCADVQLFEAAGFASPRTFAAMSLDLTKRKMRHA